MTCDALRQPTAAAATRFGTASKVLGGAAGLERKQVEAAEGPKFSVSKFGRMPNVVTERVVFGSVRDANLLSIFP